jgi:excisionase family DNA binding protein
METTSERSAAVGTVCSGGGRHAGAEAASAPLLLDVGDVARLLSCSERHVYRLSRSMRMPEPVRLGALIRWRRADLEKWLAAGCPDARSMRRQ